MAKSKHQNSRRTKHEHRKKRGKETDITELRAYLDVLGLKIIQVTPDGNCFFRALADQLEGDEDEHEKYRNMVVRFIKNNREMFEPFVEDEVPFDDYCQSMGQEGNWAGHMELQAASLVTHCNICIHQHLSPRWYTQNFDVLEARMIHLSYHDGEHYNSVRCKDDTCSGPARHIIIEDDTDHSAAVVQKTEAGGCENSEKVEQALNEGCDIEIKVLKADQIFGDDMVSVDEIHSLVINRSYDEHQEMKCEHEKLKDDVKALEHDVSYNGFESVHSKDIPLADEKKILKNKACTCSPKRKCKYCRSVSGKASARFPVNQAFDYMKSRKDRRRGRKGPSSVSNSIQSNGGRTDGGALCI